MLKLLKADFKNLVKICISIQEQEIERESESCIEFSTAYN